MLSFNHFGLAAHKLHTFNAFTLFEKFKTLSKAASKCGIIYEALPPICLDAPLNAVHKLQRIFKLASHFSKMR